MILLAHPDEVSISILRLHSLRSLSLHNNLLTYLPREILNLVHLEELSLRGNPLVVRFVRDLTYNPPSLQELAGRTIKTRNVPYAPSDLPENLVRYLSLASNCPNPKCGGKFAFTALLPAFCPVGLLFPLVCCVFSSSARLGVSWHPNSGCISLAPALPKFVFKEAVVLYLLNLGAAFKVAVLTEYLYLHGNLTFWVHLSEIFTAHPNPPWCFYVQKCFTHLPCHNAG